MAITEYAAGDAFPGVIERTTDESSPAWPAPVRASAGAPNVITIVLDDIEFGQLGCYGSPITTPNFDAIAGAGVRYNNMHTAALCSPSRSCIINGRNHHANGMAAITQWHLTPSNQETAVRPYGWWPLGRGFQRFYGFLDGDTSQCYPDLV